MAEMDYEYSIIPSTETVLHPSYPDLDFYRVEKHIFNPVTEQMDVYYTYDIAPKTVAPATAANVIPSAPTLSPHASPEDPSNINLPPSYWASQMNLMDISSEDLQAEIDQEQSIIASIQWNIHCLTQYIHGTAGDDSDSTASIESEESIADSHPTLPLSTYATSHAYGHFPYQAIHAVAESAPYTVNPTDMSKKETKAESENRRQCKLRRTIGKLLLFARLTLRIMEHYLPPAERRAFCEETKSILTNLRGRYKDIVDMCYITRGSGATDVFFQVVEIYLEQRRRLHDQIRKLEGAQEIYNQKWLLTEGRLDAGFHVSVSLTHFYDFLLWTFTNKDPQAPRKLARVLQIVRGWKMDMSADPCLEQDVRDREKRIADNAADQYEAAQQRMMRRNTHHRRNPTTIVYLSS
jgi:hypothetical protein